jgi:hypothetical protein
MGPGPLFLKCEPGPNSDGFELKDSDGDVVTAKRRLLCQTTIKDGRVWYERLAGG